MNRYYRQTKLRQEAEAMMVAIAPISKKRRRLRDGRAKYSRIVEFLCNSPDVFARIYVARHQPGALEVFFYDLRMLGFFRISRPPRGWEADAHRLLLLAKDRIKSAPLRRELVAQELERLVADKGPLERFVLRSEQVTTL